MKSAFSGGCFGVECFESAVVQGQDAVIFGMEVIVVNTGIYFKRSGCLSG
jgi:hypothetical protein